MITLTKTLGAAAALAAFSVLIPSSAFGEDSTGPALAILSQRCLQCHGEAKMGGLDLRTREGLLAGGKRGPSVSPGHPDQSLLYQAVSGAKDDLKMPMGKDRLSAEEIGSLGKWIADGAPWTEAKLEKSEWWSFIPPVKPAPPTQDGNPIDAFINKTLDEKGLEPLSAADPRTLIRRAYIDLHGLPPTPEQVEAFVNDSSPAAWAKLVDQLLESPRYGEKWGRHWLDVVRYADTGGFETDIYFPNAWRYRDYVIKAFNDDKPFDQFVKEQIAGDELWPDDLELRGGYDIPKEKVEHLEAQIGTGLYTVGPIYHEAALDGRQYRYEWLTDAVDTTGSAFLGLTLGCARCHNHKFDALSQKDYHRMMAVFSGSEPREIPVVNKMSELGFYSGYPKLLKVEEYQDAVKRIDKAARDRVQKEVESRFSPEVLAAYKLADEERTPQQRELAAKLEAAMTEAGLKENATGKAIDLPYTPKERDERDRLIYELGKAALAAKMSMPTATVLGRAEVDYPVHMTSRGNYRSIGAEVTPGFPTAIAGENTIPEDSGKQGLLGKRAALADWLASPKNPLTARVIVNRVWQWHFGRGIVGTPNDFGKQGDPPSHPELLDWLATDFVEHGWDIKRLHRMIMTSDAYQRASGPNEADSKIDSENLYLWRMNRQRLEAEELRDSVLAVAGKLNLEMGGRPVVPPLTEDEMRGMWARDQWPASLDPNEQNRRSVYLYVKRSFPLPMFTTFDTPDSSVSCARRDVTTVAPQSLAMMNSDFMLEQAESFAEKMIAKGGDTEQWIRNAWMEALGREPSNEEVDKAMALAAAETDPTRGMRQVALLVLNLNEFLYVD